MRAASPVLGDAQRLHDLPGRPVGDADIADVAVLDQHLEGAHRLLDRRRRVEAVDLVEVDMLELEATQTVLDRGQMWARSCRAFGPSVWPKTLVATTTSSRRTLRF